MKAGSIGPGVLFVVGIAVIFGSGGNTMYMVAGDILVALAGVAFVMFVK